MNFESYLDNNMLYEESNIFMKINPIYLHCNFVMYNVYINMFFQKSKQIYTIKIRIARVRQGVY